MPIYFEKRANLRLKHPDLNFESWATYVWNDNKKLWVCIKSNGGFHETHNIKYELTKNQMMLLYISESSENLS